MSQARGWRRATVLAVTAFAACAAGTGAASANDEPIVSETDAPMAAAVGNLVANNGFEKPVVSRKITYFYGSTIGGGWTVAYHYAYSGSNSSVDLVPTRVWTAAVGQQSLELNGENSGAVEQYLSTVSGQRYTIKFRIAGSPFGGETIKKARVRFGDATFVVKFNTTGKTNRNMGWKTISTILEATSSSTRLAFESLSYYYPNGLAIDDVQVVPV